MSLSGKLEANVDIKASADKFYKMCTSEHHHMPKISDKVHVLEVHEGDWESHGSVKFWNFTIDGKEEIIKEKIEHDDANKTVKLTCLEGHVLELYKSYKVSVQALPKNEGASVKVTVEYEKLKSESPEPDRYLNWGVNAIKDMDAHLVKA